MKKSKKKKILISILIVFILFLLYALWLSFHLLRFKTYKSYIQEISPLEIEGAYHMHSLFSDGRASIDKIAKIASKKSLDFIILTDHGHPNYKSMAHQGWKEGLLVLAGSELSVSRGHLVGLGFNPPSHPFSQNAEEAVYQIKSSKGFSIIAHPYSKVSWSWGEFIDYSGIEIINADSMLMRNILPALPYLPALFIKPNYSLLKMLDSPWRNLRKWDELNLIHPIYGYFALDAHFLYAPLFSFLHLHLLLTKPLSSYFEKAKFQVYNTLRKGNFYNAIDGAAQAKGFKFFGRKKKKGRKIPMGAAVTVSPQFTLHIKAPFSFAKEIHLIRDGKIILRSQKSNLLCSAQQPGIYRVEIYLRERSPLGKNIPWIVSNPIFLRENK